MDAAADADEQFGAVCASAECTLADEILHVHASQWQPMAVNGGRRGHGSQWEATRAKVGANVRPKCVPFVSSFVFLSRICAFVFASAQSDVSGLDVGGVNSPSGARGGQRNGHTMLWIH